MGDRVYTFPYEVLVIWRRHHGALTDEQSSRFLRDPNVERLGSFHSYVVEAAIRRTPDLAKALAFITSTQPLSSVAPIPQPRRRPMSPKPKTPVAGATGHRERRLAERLSATNRWRDGGTFIRRAQVYADDQRVNPTEAEARLGLILRQMYPGTGRVQVQWIFGKTSSPFILDFFIPEVRLGIEVDGPIHGHPHVKAKDESKSYFARGIGITLKRVTNETVLRSEPGALRKVITGWYQEAEKYGLSRKRRPR